MACEHGNVIERHCDGCFDRLIKGLCDLDAAVALLRRYADGTAAMIEARAFLADYDSRKGDGT